jgi:GxxExxY protein
MAEGLINDALTHKIIGCAMQVHNSLGSGFQETIYQNALELELNFNNIPFARGKGNVYLLS